MEKATIPAFLLAISKDTTALLSGIGSVILATIGAASSHPIPNWTWWITSALCFLYASYRIWKIERLKILELEEPKLIILFDPSNPTYSRQESSPKEDGGVDHRWAFKIGIKNITNRTIENVSLHLAAMEPNSGIALPARMQVNSEDGALNPQLERIFHVFQKHSSQDCISILHDVPYEATIFKNGTYRLKFIASGKDASFERWFRIWLDNDGRLRLCAEDQLQNTKQFSLSASQK